MKLEISTFTHGSLIYSKLSAKHLNARDLW